MFATHNFEWKLPRYMISKVFKPSLTCYLYLSSGPQHMLTGCCGWIMCEPYFVLHSLQGPKSNGFLGRKDKPDSSKGKRQEMSRWQESSVSAGPQAISSRWALSLHAGESEILHGAGHAPSILLNKHVPQSEVEMGREGPPHLSKSQFPRASPNVNALPHVILVSQMTDFSGNI